MMTVLVIVFLLRGTEVPQSMAIPFDPYVTVRECQESAGPALQGTPQNIEMLGWSCVSLPFVKASSI